MDLGAISLLLILLVIVGLFVAQPFSKGWRAKLQSSHEISALLAERERALNALMELDFDNGIGKIPSDEYSSQRAVLIQKGSDILRQLDEIKAAQPASVAKLVESELAAQHITPPSDDDLEEMIAKRRSQFKQKSAGFCPSCGRPILKTDKFCPSCGQKVDSV